MGTAQERDMKLPFYAYACKELLSFRKMHSLL
jgi:hypothetical protein